MAQSIESFVSKLQEDGVQAGEKKARQIQDDAARQAETIRTEAQAQAEKTIAQAQAEAESIVSRGRTELQLAARDTVLKLRETLSVALQAVLATATEDALNDPEFIKTALTEITRQYAENDAKGNPAIQVSLSKDMQEKLGDWAIDQLDQKVDIQGVLNQAGFEYKATGANVEVTTDAVVESLSQMVSARLKDVLNQAMAEKE
ncbi:MAG: hypothetical protein ACLFUJ_14655 [Phycisphaerae bacterium]